MDSLIHRLGGGGNDWGRGLDWCSNDGLLSGGLSGGLGGGLSGSWGLGLSSLSLGGLLGSLWRGLALDGLAELGEGGEGLLGLLALRLSGLLSLLLLLSKTEWESGLALLSLGLGGGLGSGLSGNSLGGDGGRAGNAGGKGLGLLNGRDNWGLSAGHNLIILGWDNWGGLGSLLGSKSGLEVKEGRVALGCSGAGLWDSGLLDNGGLSSRGLSRGSSLLGNGGLLDNWGLNNGLLLGLSLVGNLLLLAAQVESTEDGVALAAGRAALGACLLLLLGLLLSLLLLVLSLGLLSGDSLVLLLVLNLGDDGGDNGSRLAQASVRLLVTLAAGDGLGRLLGLGGLLLEGSDPVVTVNKVGGLEGVLLVVADESELDGAVLLDIGDIGL